MLTPRKTVMHFVVTMATVPPRASRLERVFTILWSWYTYNPVLNRLHNNDPNCWFWHVLIKKREVATQSNTPVSDTPLQCTLTPKKGYRIGGLRTNKYCVCFFWQIDLPVSPLCPVVHLLCHRYAATQKGFHEGRCGGSPKDTRCTRTLFPWLPAH